MHIYKKAYAEKKKVKFSVPLVDIVLVENFKPFLFEEPKEVVFKKIQKILPNFQDQFEKEDEISKTNMEKLSCRQRNHKDETKNRTSSCCTIV